MRTEYSILDNKPLDHWKVTELKDELRRRKMTTKGLKEDLIKRLDEAVRTERAQREEHEISSNQEILVTHQTEKVPDQTVEHFDDSKSENHAIMVDINSPVVDPNVEMDFHPENSTKTIDLEETVVEKATDISVEKEVSDAVQSSEPDVVVPESQVSEVSPDLGLQVKSDPISTDSVSLGEKIELKNDLNLNNIDLEEPVKPELVPPSPHLLDVNESYVEEDDSKKTDGSIAGSPEKLNLDRSSGDESMDEDVLDTKHVESNDNLIEVGEKEVRDLHVVKEEAPAVSEGETRVLASTEKRKAEDQDSVESAEPIKRQRRWAAEIKIPEKQAQQPPHQSLAATSPNVPTAVTVSTPRLAVAATDSDSPKERVVPPSQKTPTTSLRIDRFLRPFTLKAVQELLAKTGTVSSFWMDHIKTHCYVTYSSVEEAVATRDSVYNLQWPVNGGRLLVADFVDPVEVKARVEAPPESPVPTTPVPVVPTRQPPVNVIPAAAKEKLLPPPPPLPPAAAPPAKVAEPPILTLDDLFKKTKAAPRIYYLPLTEEQVAAKAKNSGR